MSKVKRMGLSFMTLDDVDVKGKRILVRADLNCSLDPETRGITDDSRIRATAPTLRELRDSRVVLMAHQGRPGSKDFVSLRQHAERLRQLGLNATFVDDIFGERAKQAIEQVEVGQVLVLENVRMFDGEMKKGPPEIVAKEPIVQELYPYFDLFVNDAFGTAHRPQPSVIGFTVYLPSVAGRLVEREISVLTEVLSSSAEPRVFAMGGAKVGDKVALMRRVLEAGCADRVLTGGLIATLFLVVSGILPRHYAASIKEFSEAEAVAEAILSDYSDHLLLPADVAIEMDGQRIDTPVEEAGGGPILDIGPRTMATYAEVIRQARLVFANGPMGFFEKRKFASGTRSILNAMADCKGTTVVGGGHLGAVARSMELANRISHISTGGGATMAFLAGKRLPLIEALEAAANRMTRK